MIDRQGQQGSPARPRPVRRQMQQGDGIPAPGQSQGHGRGAIGRQPPIQPREQPPAQPCVAVRSGWRLDGRSNRGQPQPPAVRNWVARAFWASFAVGA